MSTFEDTRRKFDEIAAQWEREDPGSTDIESTVTPEMDLSGPKDEAPANRLRKAFDEASVNPEELPSRETGDTKPVAGDQPASASEKSPEPPTEPWAKIQFELQQNAARKPATDPLREKMIAAGWAPKESAAPPDWEKLQAALQGAERGAGMTQAIQQGYQAVTGGRFHADPNAGAEEIAAAKVPLDIEQAKQHQAEAAQRLQSEQLAAHQKLLEQAKKAALDDPTSAESKREQAAFRDIFKDSRRVPSGLEQMSANEIADLRHSMVPLAAQDVTAAHNASADAEKKAADAAKEAEKNKNAAAEAKSLEDERALILADPRAKKMGLKPEMVDGLDRKGLDEFRKQLDSIKQDKGGGGGVPTHVKAGDLSSVPEDMRETVRGIAEYRIPAPEAGSRNGQKILNYVTAFRPDFDSSKYGAYKSLREHLARDPEIVAANTAIEHLRRIKENVPEDWGGPALNRVRNAVLSGVGSDQLTPFETDVKVAADEIARAYGNNTEGGKQAQEHLFDGSMTKKALLKRLDEQEVLLGTRNHQKMLQFEAAQKGDLGIGAPPPGGLETRRMKRGGTAYKGKTSGRWFDNAEEAEKN